MIGVYIRVSTYDQNLDSQRAEITRWLKSHEKENGVLWFEDQETGKTLKRPALPRVRTWTPASDSYRSYALSLLGCIRAAPVVQQPYNL